MIYINATRKVPFSSVVSEFCRTFAIMNERKQAESPERSCPESKNVILADADYIDKVTFDLIVNFERIIGRRIPPADMARWIDCAALDGGLREGAHETQVVLIHGKQRQRLDNFVPADYAQELNDKAFRDHLGEFCMTALPVEELVSAEDFFIETLEVVAAQKDVKRIIVVPADSLYGRVRETLNRVQDEEKRMTVLTMEPKPGGHFRQEMLGYSLMAALGIRADEIQE